MANTRAIESASCLFIPCRIPLLGVGATRGLRFSFVQLVERGGYRLTKPCFALHSRSNSTGERVEFGQHLRVHEFLWLLHAERLERANCQTTQQQQGRALEFR